ncbi:hypothetical protein ACVWWW_000191 [Lysobacter sp. HA18]
MLPPNWQAVVARLQARHVRRSALWLPRMVLASCSCCGIARTYHPCSNRCGSTRGLTIRPSRRRFAARLSSGVRAWDEQRGTWGHMKRSAASLLLVAALTSILAWRTATAERGAAAAFAATEGSVDHIERECSNVSGRGSQRIKCSSFPVVGFYTASGQKYFFRCTTGRSARHLHEGQSVQVLYEPGNAAATARIAGYGIELWQLLAGVATTLLVLAIAVAISPSRPRPNNSSKPTPLRGA